MSEINTEMECSKCRRREADDFNYCYDCHIFTTVVQRKKAVICGISYESVKKGPFRELKACIGDAKSFMLLLINTFQFPESNIRLLTDEEGTNPDMLPKKENIISAMKWLVEDCQAGDSLVFYFAGHGGQKRDTDGDEIDGYDETLVPLDYTSVGEIIDDEINRIMVNPLPTGCKLHAIVDACHSGTVLDLEWLCRMDSSGEHVWKDNRPQNSVNKGTSGGEVFAFSACNDDQEAGDAPALASQFSVGAMTFAFLQAMELNEADTYGRLLHSMKNAAENYQNPHFVEKPSTSNKPPVQDPQLTSNHCFDIYKKHFSL